MKFITLLLLFLVIFILGCGSTSDTSNTTVNSLRVACVGDSITAGTGLSNPLQDSYPVQLQSILGQNWDVGNFGKKSATLMKNGSLPYWNTSAFTLSHEYNPDIVVIMLGTNDAKPGNWINNSTFISDYTELIQTYKNLPSQPTVYICYPPQVYGIVAGITNSRIVNEVIPKIADVARVNGVGIIDIYSVLSNKKELFPDKIHPNKEGARLLAEKVYQIIY